MARTIFPQTNHKQRTLCTKVRGVFLVYHNKMVYHENVVIFGWFVREGLRVKNKSVHISGWYAIISAIIGAILSAACTYYFTSNANDVSKQEYQALQSKIEELESDNASLKAQLAEATAGEPDPGTGNNPGTGDDSGESGNTDGDNIVGKTNILALPPFKEGRNEFLYASGDRVDNVGNSYPDGYLIMYNSLDNSVREKCYILDKKYSNLSGEIALSYNDKDVEGEIWLEFYDGENLIDKTESLYSGVRPVDFSIDVSQVSELTIRVNGGSRSSSMLTQGFYLE